MVEKLTATFRDLGLLLGVLILPSNGFAHRLDEYLQATLVTIEPGEVRLQINLTPGVAVAERVLAQIDRDHNGVISTSEAAAYAELVRHHLTIELDHRKVVLSLAASHYPAPTELRTGWGIIQLEFSAAIGPLRDGAHKLNLKNRHLPALSVYLLNATQPRSGLVQIARQTRNNQQSIGEIEFVIAQTERASRGHSTNSAQQTSCQLPVWRACSMQSHNTHR